jgi:uncharacterized protein
MPQLSLSAARALMLDAQGLLQPRSKEAKKADVLDAIRTMGMLQIDTISVVNRSPYLVLWSRLGDYNMKWLDELLAEGDLFEYWSHAACFLPIEDYPLYRRLMLDGQKGWTSAKKWLEEHAEVVEQVMSRVHEHGPVRSSDFERTDGQKGAWWNWKEEKLALEALFNTGDLMIARRHNFQRLYDLRHRILPTWEDAHAPSYEEVRRTMTLKAVKALGIAAANWIPDYFYMPKQGIKPYLEKLADEGALLRVEVEGQVEPFYVHPDHQKSLKKAESLKPSLTTLLSPFDPLTSDRKRALSLFNFDYRIECYTPAPKRRYGYFTLPILWRGQLIGRLDPKAHRKEKIFEIKALHLEPGVVVTDEMIADLAAMLRACASWHQTPEVMVRMSDPPVVAERLTLALA